jgi:hypothetical protein
MTAEAAILSRSWRVGDRVCTISLPPVDGAGPRCACIEWSPSPPANLSVAEWVEYRTGRNAAVEELARALGVTAAVLEI